MVIDRPDYIEQLIRKKDNGLIKVVTGVRRSGKSFLLFTLYHNYLNSIGVSDDCIIELALDEKTSIRYRNPFELDKFVREAVADSDKRYYVFLDEIQLVKAMPNPYLDEDTVGFVDTLLGLMKLKNADIYVTGSNSKMLSSDIVTEFRDRGDEIRVYPLSYKEFYSAYEGDKYSAWQDYYTYGGLPRVLQLSMRKEKSDYLSGLFEKTYITDVIERNDIRNDKVIIDELLNAVSSSVGSLTNPTKLSNTFKSVKNWSVNSTTIDYYLDCFMEAFILDKAYRYDIKGKKYINTPLKYYFVDIGLRNARLNFRQQEENHIMENVLYNELKIRGYNVDVGVVEYRHSDKTGKDIRSWLEVDFVVNDVDKIYYIQSALTVADEEKRLQEVESLNRIPDSFRKIVVVKDNIIPWHDEHGILYIGIEQFLLDNGSINL